MCVRKLCAHRRRSYLRELATLSPQLAASLAAESVPFEGEVDVRQHDLTDVFQVGAAVVVSCNVRIGSRVRMCMHVCWQLHRIVERCHTQLAKSLAQDKQRGDDEFLAFVAALGPSPLLSTRVKQSVAMEGAVRPRACLAVDRQHSHTHTFTHRCCAVAPPPVPSEVPALSEPAKVSAAERAQRKQVRCAWCYRYESL